MTSKFQQGLTLCQFLSGRQRLIKTIEKFSFYWSGDLYLSVTTYIYIYIYIYIFMCVCIYTQIEKKSAFKVISVSLNIFDITRLNLIAKLDYKELWFN